MLKTMNGVLREFEDSLSTFFEEFGYPCRLQQFKHNDSYDYLIHVPRNTNENEFMAIVAPEIIALSQSWKLKIQNVRYSRHQIVLHLERASANIHCIKSVVELASDYGRTSIFSRKRILLTNDVNGSPATLTELRKQLSTKLLQKILALGGASVISTISEGEIIDKHIHLGSNDLCEKYVEKDNFSFGYVNGVANSNRITISEYRKKRIEKLKSKNDKINSDLSEEEWESLTDALISYDLLKVKTATLLQLTVDDEDRDRGSVIFAMYNYIRLKAILETFEDKSKAGLYPELPKLEDVDFSCLTDKNEWRLIFNYALSWPNVLMDIVTLKDDNSGYSYKIHIVVKFLQGLTLCISSFYSQTQVLTEPRPKLLPFLFARIYLLKMLTQLISNCFALLEIKSLAKM